MLAFSLTYVPFEPVTSIDIWGQLGATLGAIELF
jgi:hypothetical protein